MAVETPVCDFGWRAPDFSLPGIDGKQYALEDIKGQKGTLIMFISNHCPYVRAVEARIVRDARELKDLGIGVVAICSNDALAYPDDDLAHMAQQARRAGFTFPYLHDESQDIARAYNAACTPDFFGFDGCLGLQYRGRLDASRKETGPPDLRRDLYEGMTLIAETGKGPVDQIPSVGCSIKWKSTD